MLTIDKIKNLKFERRKILLPKMIRSVGNCIFLPGPTPEANIGMLENQNFFIRKNYYRYLFRDYKFRLKLFRRRVVYSNRKERNASYQIYAQSKNVKITPLINLSVAERRNCMVDISQYLRIFFSFDKKQWKLIVTEFFDLLSGLVNDQRYKIYKEHFLIFDLEQWDIHGKTTALMKMNIFSNPFSIMYIAMRRMPEVFKDLGNVHILITDGLKGYFKIEPMEVEAHSFIRFKLALSKLRPDLLPSELDDDNHLDDYGGIPEDAPEEKKEEVKQEEKTKEKIKVAAKRLNLSFNISDLDDAVADRVLDDIKSMGIDKKVDIKTDDGLDTALKEIEKYNKKVASYNINDDEEYGDLTSRSDDDDEDSQFDEDEEDEDEDDELKDEKNEEIDVDDDEDEEEDEREAELNELLNGDDEVIKDIQELIADKIDDNPTSAREKVLKERQKQLKIDNERTLEEILSEEKNNPSLMDLPDMEIKDHVQTLNANITNVKFTQFEKEYNKKVMEHDFIAIFDSLSKHKDLPVYIRDIKKEDTSDSLNLKETWYITLEDPKYNRTHNFTIDVPKFIDGKFMYLGGNKKIFIKQLILKPIVKISPDTVQICTNYAKMFIFRYGENISPKVQNSIKVLSSNDKYFSVTKGNSLPFNKQYKTTIEYDSLAKIFTSIKIKKSDSIFLFSQKLVNDFITKNQLEGIMKNIDRDEYLVIGFRKNLKGQWEPMIVDTDESATVSTGFNNDDGIDPEETGGVNVIDVIFDEVKKVNNAIEISDLFGEEAMKIGKRYVYSRCKVMKKFIPTILLLSYFEGLTTILRKAQIKYTFMEKRPRFDNNLEKLNKGVIPFADGFLVFDRYPIQNSMLMNAFTMVDTKSYEFKDMDDKMTYVDIFGNLYKSRILASGLDSFYDSMIDPISKELLHSMNYPETFTELILFANVILCDNNYSSEIDMKNFRVRSNEMVNGMLYKIVANAFAKYKRTANNRSPMKITVPKTTLIKEIVTSQSVEDYSILNPVVEVEKSRAITCKGPSGINVDQSYTLEKRSFDKSMTGLLTVSTSPDANCGVVRTLTTDPKIVSPRGYIDTKKEIESMTDANLFGLGEMLTPLGVTKDDAIRTAMATKQS